MEFRSIYTGDSDLDAVQEIGRNNVTQRKCSLREEDER